MRGELISWYTGKLVDWGIESQLEPTLCGRPQFIRGLGAEVQRTSSLSGKIRCIPRSILCEKSAST